MSSFFSSLQLVYNPEDPALGSLSYHLSPKLLSPDSNRPISFGESSNSDSLSPPGSTTALFHRQPKIGGGGRILDRERGGGVSRKDSIRSTVSEKLNLEEEIRFLDSRLRAMPSDQLASTPEVCVCTCINTCVCVCVRAVCVCVCVCVYVCVYVRKPRCLYHPIKF